MWIAKNGAFCYYSKKEEREVQYYKAEDIKNVTVGRLAVAKGETCKEHTFTLTLKWSGTLSCF